jgi:hypothetical protein
MPAPFSGGCRCGAVRYDVSAEPTFAAHCYCRDCQYASGGAGATVIVVPHAAVAISGPVATYASTADSGAAVRRMFCATCGSPLFAENARAPLVLVIRVASLDDPGWVRPQAHIWTDSAPPWVSLDDELPKFPRNAS